MLNVLILYGNSSVYSHFCAARFCREQQNSAIEAKFGKFCTLVGRREDRFSRFVVTAGGVALGRNGSICSAELLAMSGAEPAARSGLGRTLRQTGGPRLTNLRFVRLAVRRSPSLGSRLASGGRLDLEPVQKPRTEPERRGAPPVSTRGVENTGCI